ncbi:AsmA-like C-terminal domain-containing protein, partial [Syntrophotalea acetylenica]|uniref:YhdP family protein n=1 Tax=Syntrophotalea acetylenica TaxID=29542 RepID=UPI002A36D464
DGAFYLQGPAGPELLIRGKGGADIRMKNGVLYRFSFLSKVFSLLNVSQIFSFRLPDMAQKGMPFKRLDATLRLDEGHLETEDLIVESNAMNLSLVGNWDLRQDRLNLVMGVKPFGTVDKIVSSIPLAGWILTGESKALITAHFRISGPSGDPDVDAIPVTSVSEKVLGIFQRMLGLPGKVIEDVGELFQTGEP